MSAPTIEDIRRYEYLLQFKWLCPDDQCDGLPHVRMPHKHARAAQRPPRGDWDVWVLCSGRGFGKTRTGAQYTRDRILEFKGAKKSNRAMIIAPTKAAARDICVNGESGLLACTPEDRIKGFNSQTGELTFKNGGIVKLFGADDEQDAEAIRGYQCHTAWFEELATQRWQQVAWDNAAFANRLGDPRTIVTTTPRPTKLVKRLLKPQERYVVTRGSTFDNRANLAGAFIRRMEDNYVGTRLEQQELNGELVEDVRGALWTRGDIECVTGVSPSAMARIVVAVDPPGGHKITGAQCGIVVAGIDAGGRCYVFEDLSDWLEPEQWADRAVDAYHRYEADQVVAERNFGGDMVMSTLRGSDRTVPVTMLQASRGKLARAEPIIPLYKRREVVHAGVFADLEDQMCAWVPPGRYDLGVDGTPETIAESDYSPDRIDALVWAVTELRGLAGKRVAKPRARFHAR